MTIAFVQSRQGVALSATAGTISITPTAGDMLYATVQTWNNQTALSSTSISDNQGNVWSAVRITGSAATNDGQHATYYAPNAKAAATTVTLPATGGATGTGELLVAEWSGVATVAPLDTSSLNSGTTTQSNGSITPNQAAELMLFSSGAGSLTGTSPAVNEIGTAPAGMTQRAINGTGANDNCVALYDGSTAAGANSESLTFSASAGAANTAVLGVMATFFSSTQLLSVTKTFVFASTAESWTSIAALASGETNGLDTTIGNPADSLVAKITGKTKVTTTGAGLTISGDLFSFWGVPAGATITAVRVALDKKQTANTVQGTSHFWQTKLVLGASNNTGPSQNVGTGADASWVSVTAANNAALSGLAATSGTLELDILYGLSTSASGTTTSTQQVNWDNIAVTLTYLPGSTAWTAPAAETVLVTDIVARVFAGSRNDTSTVNVISDAPNRVLAVLRALADTVSSTDAVGCLHGFLRNVADPVAVASAAIRVFTGARSTPETVQGTDAGTRSGGFGRQANDTQTAADTNARSIGLVRAVIDLVIAADAATRGAAYQRLLTGIATAADAVVRLVGGNRSAADTATTTDIPAAPRGLLRSLADATGVADLAIRLGVFGRQDTSASSLADAADRAQALARQDADTEATQDQPNRVVALLRAVAQTVQALDSAAAALSGGATAWVVTAADTALTSAVVSRVLSLVRPSTDTDSTADSTGRQVGITRIAQDADQTLDASSRQTDLTRSGQEATTSPDTTARTYGATRTTSDSATTGDSATRSHGIIASAVETVTGNDAFGTASAYLRSVADAIHLTDLVAAIVSVFQTPGTIDIAMTAPYTLDAAVIAPYSLDVTADAPSSISAAIAQPGTIDAVMASPYSIDITISAAA